MNKNLQNYVRVLPNWLDAEKCKEIVIDLEQENWKQHKFYNNNAGKSHTVSDNKELDVVHKDGQTTDYVMKKMWEGYFEYIKNLNFSWFGAWNGFTQVRFNRYTEDRLMAEHCDHIHSMFDGERKGIPILTCIAVLNDDYEGGEFVMWEDEVIPLKAGEMLIFPSIFLYPHKVNPVKSGVRYSCVSWAY